MVEGKERAGEDVRLLVSDISREVSRFLELTEREISTVREDVEGRSAQCAEDIERLERVIRATEAQTDLNRSTASKEQTVADAFREHSEALREHIQNTQLYLTREVETLEAKLL